MHRVAFASDHLREPIAGELDDGLRLELERARPDVLRVLLHVKTSGSVGLDVNTPMIAYWQ
jgi:hypothetical protein